MSRDIKRSQFSKRLQDLDNCFDMVNLKDVIIQVLTDLEREV